jgi:hypothetical protein
VFTQVTITCTTIWDEVSWHATATWREDAESQPVVLTRGGRAPLNGEWSPHAIAQACIRAMGESFGQVQEEIGSGPLS